MGNEGSLPSDTESQVSDWQSLYSHGSRAGRRSSLGSVRIPSPMEPPEPDLSHLSPEEVAKIREVIDRAKEMKEEEHRRIKQLEEEYVTYAADVERRATEAVASTPDFKKENPLCPICLVSELKIKEGMMTDGQNVCADCGNLTCLNCGNMEQSVTSKEMEWVCHVCHKRRQLVLSTGLWHPGCDVDEEVPLAREVEYRLLELEQMSLVRGPLTRSTSVDGHGACGGPSLQRQMSMPDYKMQIPLMYPSSHTLEVIQETGLSDNVSDNASPEPPYTSPEPPSVKADSPTESDEMKKSTTSSTAGGGGSIRAMGQPSSRSESEYSDGASDVDMDDMSMMRSVTTDGISPDEGSDDYSFMSIGSSDNDSGNVRRKHRPKSLNLSRSISATSSEDETSDSAISTDVESKYNAVAPPNPHEIRIALAASAFVEDMRVVDLNNETDEEVAEISAHEESAMEGKVRFSPSAPVSPSWREGLDSPPFSPRRRDSYPGKRRGSSPVSPKDRKFTYTDISPPSRQLSLEELYDKETHATNNEHSLVPFAQRPSPKSPDEMKDSFYSTSGEMLTFDRPTSNLKKSKPFYSLDDANVDLNDTTTVMDLATYAATVASNTANLTSMTVSPTNLDKNASATSGGFGYSENLGSPSSPDYYDNVSFPDEHPSESEGESDAELADPSQKSIDYQGSKRQKARPPTTDWSPVIDLSPILDVSPSLEEAEQAEMLAQQQEERQRQASRDEDSCSPKVIHGGASGVTQDVDYMYYGLKRYEVVEDISELVKQNNGTDSPDAALSTSTENEEKQQQSTLTSANDDEHESNGFVVICTSIAPSKASDTITCSQCVKGFNSSVNSTTNVSDSRKKDITMNSKTQSPKSEAINSKTSEEPSHAGSAKGKPRRKLPEPTAEIVATQRPPVPKPRRKDRPSEPPPVPQKPARVPKQEIREPSRHAPTLIQTNPNVKPNTSKSNKSALVKQESLPKQDSEERRRTAKDMKAKPDPIIMNHIEIEEASSSPQYKVLESPPSPENKSAIRREYSDSTSVSPSSSPDREVYLYPSPVTPPDSDSSPPKPHSPSSGTDFEDEFIFVEDIPKSKPKDAAKSTGAPEKRHEIKQTKDRSVPERIATSEKDTSPHAKNKSQTPPSRDHKQKDMKKIRRKLPPIPAEEEVQSAKPKQRPVPPRKPLSRNDAKLGRKLVGTSSASDDSSMNEDDKEVASITRKKKTINDLDKPSLDKRNGNYLANTSASICANAEEALNVNIPPDFIRNSKHDAKMVKLLDETDEIIDSLINIYGAPITQAMKGLKRRLQEELRRVTEGRRRTIDEIEEIRVLKLQLGELKIGTDKSRSSNKSNLSVPGSNGKKRAPANSRTSPQLINRRARHKRQSSDPMVAKFSPIKEDKDIESEIQIVQLDDGRICRTADDSSQSGISDTDSTRSEPIHTGINKGRKIKPQDYAKMFYSKHAQSSEYLDKNKDYTSSPQLISSHSEGNLPSNTDDEDYRSREEKRRELQFEIEKRKRQLAERQAKLRETRSNMGSASKQLAQSCDEISATLSVAPCLPPRPIPTGIIKPIDDDTDSFHYKQSYHNQTSYSSTEYLAHKQEELMQQRFDDLSSFSAPFLYSGDYGGEKSAFVPQLTRNKLDMYSYSTGNVNMGKDPMISSSATLPNLPTSHADVENNNRIVQGAMSDTEASPPYESTPAMPLLTDVKARSRKIIREIGSGSRPVSAEFNVGVEDLMNGMYRVESDNSVDADEPIMKHMTEGGVTILKQLERKKQPPPSKPKKYDFPVKRILLTTDPKEKSIKGRHGNGIGMKIVGGKSAPGCADVGAYVAAIYKGGVADQLHGEVNEGDQILEWNGLELTGKSYEEVQQVISQPNGEIELVIRPSHASKKVLGDTTASAPSCHSSYDNIDSDEEREAKIKAAAGGIDPKQLSAQLEGIEEDESPSISHSSSQHDYSAASASSGCSSPLSEPTSTSSDQRARRSTATATATVVSSQASTQYNQSHGQGHEQGQGYSQGTGHGQGHGQCQGQGSGYGHGQFHKTVPQPMDRYDNKQMNASQQPPPPYFAVCKPPTNSVKVLPTATESFRQIQVQPPETVPPVPPKSKPVPSLDAHAKHSPDATKPKSPKDKPKRELSPRKRELNQQSNSFDDFLRMSKHGGHDDCGPNSPSKSRDPRDHASPKRGLSVSTSELTRRKADVENDIQKSQKGCSRGDRQMGDIQLQLKHDDYKSAFSVHVKQARNLLPKDLNGLSDPFVKIYLLPGRSSDNKRRTKHIARTLNPEWKEHVIFPNVHIEELRNKTLEVTVWDYDRFKANDFLGEVVLNLSEEAFLDNMPHWYPLCAHDESKGMELPQPTVLPPRSSKSVNTGSPRAKSRDRADKAGQNNGARNERVRHGLGRRRRSFDTLQDVDKV